MNSKAQISLEETVLGIMEKGFKEPRRVYKFIKISHPNISKIKVYNIVFSTLEKTRKGNCHD